MKTLNRIAKPCGIAGGVWGVLFAVILSLLAPTRMVTSEISMEPDQYVTNTIESIAWGTVAIIIIMLLLGILGLLGLILSRRITRTSRIFIWISSLGMLVLSLALMFVFISPSGLILLPAAILLILAAIGMGKKEEALPVEAT
jgi:Ca2+/Na+ antiporter